MVGRLLRTCLGLLAAGAIAAPPAAASVLYVGDSLGVGTSPYLEQRLGAGEVEADVVTGRPSGAGVDVLASLLGPEHEVVVFDLGTNDDPAAPEALAADLSAAAGLADGRCLVVATLNRPPLNGVAVDGLNRAVTSFASRSPNVALVDWHGAASADPGLLTDGVHSDADGYAARATLFADAIASCSSIGGAAGASSSAAEPDLGPLPPAASAGSNEPQRAAAPERRGERGPDPELEALATELARAIATGADFG